MIPRFARDDVRECELISQSAKQPLSHLLSARRSFFDQSCDFFRVRDID